MAFLTLYYFCCWHSSWFCNTRYKDHVLNKVTASFSVVVSGLNICSRSCKFRDTAWEYGIDRQLLRCVLLIFSSKYSQNMCDISYLYGSQQSLNIAGPLTEWILERRVLSAGYRWNSLGIAAKGRSSLKRSKTWAFGSLEFIYVINLLMWENFE
jgi:hypothetical protein